MAILSDYTAGTVSIDAAGTALTGVGTAWQTAGFSEGDEFIADGWRGIIASVDSETTITLYPTGIRGAALAGANYRLRYMSDGARQTKAAIQLIQLLSEGGNLEAIAELESDANTLAYFDGAGSAALTALTALGRGLIGIDGPSNTDKVPYINNAGALALMASTAFGRGLIGIDGPSNTNKVPYVDNAGVLALMASTAFGRALAGLTGAANKGIYASGEGTADTFDFTLFMRGLMGSADATAAQTNLGGSALGRGLFTAASQAAAKTILGLGSAADTTYEVGSFNPGMAGETTPGSPAYAAQAGNYIRIGNLVFALIYVVVTSLGGATGALQITGLPFNRAGGTQKRAAMAVPFWGGFNLPAGAGGIHGFFIGDGNAVRLQFHTNTSGTGGVTDSYASGGNITIYATIVYEAAS